MKPNNPTPKPSAPEQPDHPHVRPVFRQKLLRFVIHLFGWIGIALVYYFIFSFFVDTPIEYGMKRSVAALETEYEKLNSRYDTLETVLDNIAERDRHVFRTLFDSDPLGHAEEERQFLRYDSLMNRTNRELGDDFLARLDRSGERVRLQGEDLDLLQRRIEVRGMLLNHIPSIQPVIDPDLSRIATSFGPRIQPFYKTMTRHNGIDYAVPEGTRVFATADGTVSNVMTGRANTGTTVVISHGGGYETSYHHLSKVLVPEGSRVKRGDIIALTGNTGLSLAPHLHYEVRFQGQPADPVDFFFNELSPEGYREAKRIAGVGMQSFD